MKSFLVDVSILTGATDANPVNKEVQLLSDSRDQDTGRVEAERPHESSARCKSRTSDLGQGMGKIGENFGVELDESQKQERGDR